MLAVRRLPGIRVDVAPPPPVEALPRMDVAVLVGFASTGPLHLPVAIESIGQFAAVFGPDAPLAWDATRGERVYAYLGPAVRAFFSNGGRRCWVVRVARSASSESVRRGVAPETLLDAPGIATANAFAIGGVLEVSAGTDAIAPALALARCEGSWSDRLRVASAVSIRGFGIDGFVPLSSPAGNRVTFGTRFGLRAGDLIELGDARSICAYASIDEVRVASDPSGPYTVEATILAAFERLVEAISPSSPPLTWPGTAQVAGFGGSVAAALTPQPEANEPARLQLGEPMPASLERGHWARWSDSGSTVWLRIDEIEREPAFSGSPPVMDTTLINAAVSGPAWRELGPVLPGALGAIRRAQLLSLDLQATGGEAQAFALSGVGLTPLHPEAWWNRSSDADFYRLREDAVPGPAGQAGPSDVARFPLARREQADAPAWIPLGATALFGPALAPLPQSATALERDGLADFDADLFLDPELESASQHALAELADNIRFVRAQPRPLLGLHAAWSIGAGGLFNEASLLAVPDAVHLGWHKRGEGDTPEPEARDGQAPAHWRTHRGACATPDTTPMEGPDFGVFLDCATRELRAPVLDGPDAPVPPGPYRLTWTDAEPGGRYVLLESMQADFSDAREVFSGSDREYVALAPREGVYYYQVYVYVGDDRSRGSNAIAVRVRSDDWIQQRAEDADAALEGQWLAVHRAALRLAAANGELFAALAMPRHFRTQQALRYVRRLRTVREPPGGAEAGALGFTEARALSYGAMYFPWLQSQVRTSAQRSDGTVPVAILPRAPKVVPPDGVALGVLAARASSRGAWVAPANELMKDVVALTPVVAAGDWQALQDAQINLVRADARGFLALSADTLALETELRPINVRRLLILLRRLALRRGTSFVFEPNGPTLRRAVQRAFDILLGDLFRRGAFVGATAEQAFRVVTDTTVNTPRDADAGRFLVELRVAPAVPLRFIAVRLAQSGARLSVVEEL